MGGSSLPQIAANFAAINLPLACASFKNIVLWPGAYAPDFMRAPASQAFVQSQSAAARL